ncbi:MAG TPA: hypothetical protein VKS25_06120 [Solirubrobacteraceae bacterium]|nr:hypothetical protein [Solirubrobacteraceae bacterium]
MLPLATAALLVTTAVASAGGSSYIGGLTPSTIATTVPANGDQNPYGMATVPRTVGKLVAGDILISNFNNAASTAAPGGLQGTGTTIDQINPASPQTTAPLFAQIDPNHLPRPGCPGGIGLTTALVALPDGYVIVGSLPTADGSSATAAAGCLLVINPFGRVVETIAGGLIDGPWDMTSVTTGFITTLFVSNVLPNITSSTTTPSNTGDVVRIRLATLGFLPPFPFDEDVIGVGFPARPDPAALVIGPTGLALSSSDTLYVADTLGNRIAEIPNALFLRHPINGEALTLTSNGSLNGPLGLTLASNGDVVSANSQDGNFVETTPAGKQVATVTADTNPGTPNAGAGALFGLTVSPFNGTFYYVDDDMNTLQKLG